MRDIKPGVMGGLCDSSSLFPDQTWKGLGKTHVLYMCAELLSLITQMLIRYKDIVQSHQRGVWYCLALRVLVMTWCCNNCVPPLGS